MYRPLISRGWPAFVLLFVGAGAFLGWQLRRLEVDAGTNMLLNENDPDLQYYNKTRADWEYDEYTIVCVHREDWFSPDGLQLLTDFTDALAKIENVEKVTSIQSVPLLRTRPLNLFGKIEFPTLRSPKIDLAKARDEILAHTQAVGNLISADGKNLSILVYLRVPDDVRTLEPEWNRLHGVGDKPKIDEMRPKYEAAIKRLRDMRTAQVLEIRRVCREWQPKFDEPIRLSGLPIINVNMVEHVQSDMKSFGIAAAGMFVLGFTVVFRKVRWTVLPILTCLLPVILILGSMVLLEKRITVITSNMPVLLFILMLPYTVYFVERYRERRALRPDEEPAVTSAESAKDIWIPCLYSATTTMAGTASLLTSGISPVRTFGLMMSIGMAVGLMTAFLFLPSAVRPLRALPGKEAPQQGPMASLAHVALRIPVVVVILSLALLVVAIWGTTKLNVETKVIDYFQKKSEVYAGLEYIDVRMGGTTPLEIMLRSDAPPRPWCQKCAKMAETDGGKCRVCASKVVLIGYFQSPDGFAAMRAVQEYFAGVPELGNLRSLATLVDEFKKVKLVEKAPDTNVLLLLRSAPEAQALIREFCTPDFQTARVLIRMRETAPTLNRKRILGGLHEHLGSRPELAGLAQKRPTGVFVLYSNMLQSLIKSQKDTLLLVIAVIYVMLMILFRNPLLAGLVLLPQVLPVFVVLGVMGFTGVPLDMVTTMIASVAMGVGIDPAIQYAVRFRRELASGRAHADAIVATHHSIGRAIAIAGAIVFAGFSVLALSKFVPTIYFGLFTGLAVLMGIGASLTTLPAAFVLLKYPRK